jgi:flagellum-specific peptidoglycan hydrolase FlgJ
MRAVRRLAVAVVVVVGLSACGAETDTGSASPDSAPPADSTEVDEDNEPAEEADESADEPDEAMDDPSMEFKLAAIDTSDRNPPDSTVAAYGAALDAAEPKCQQGRDEVGDMAVRATQLAEENGMQASVMDMLQGVNEAVPDDLAPMDCAEILSSILVIMQNG